MRAGSYPSAASVQSGSSLQDRRNPGEGTERSEINSGFLTQRERALGGAPEGELSPLILNFVTLKVDVATSDVTIHQIRNSNHNRRLGKTETKKFKNPNQG